MQSRVDILIPSEIFSLIFYSHVYCHNHAISRFNLFPDLITLLSLLVFVYKRYAPEHGKVA